MHKLMSLASILAVALIVSSCDRAPQPQSPLEDPEVHVSLGHRLLDRGDLEGAEAEFLRARTLDDEYAPAIAGLAVVALEREQWEQAEDLISDAKDADDRNLDAYAANIRYLSRTRPEANWFLEREDWLTRVREEAHRAFDIDDSNEDVHYWYGVALARALQFEDAARQFATVIELHGDLVGKARSQWELMQKIERAAPGTRFGKKIALVDTLTRAEFAVLLVDELQIEDVLRTRREVRYDSPEQTTITGMEVNTKPTDIDGHWAERFIRDAVSIGAMELGPDGAFNPDSAVSRSDFAFVVQNLLVLITRDESLYTRFISEETQFRDVRTDFWGYNAITLAVSRGVMNADPVTGMFYPDKTIPGVDALLMIRELQERMRLNF